jgi:hypothetical protein
MIQAKNILIGTNNWFEINIDRKTIKYHNYENSYDYGELHKCKP